MSKNRLEYGLQATLGVPISAERDQDLAGQIRKLRVSFDGTPVLHQVDLDIPKGKLTMLLGFSGSGKTTVLRSLNRLHDCFPNSRIGGEIHLLLGGVWQDINGAPVDLTELRRRVGMVFQTPNVLPTSVIRNLSLPLSLTLRPPKSELQDRVEKALREAHLWNEVEHRLHRPARELSGGQQQRLCLARALALEPEILLLDEPTSSLDFRSTEAIEETLVSLRGRYTLVAVSHDPGQAQRLADTVAVFAEGRVAARCGPNDLQGYASLEAMIRSVMLAERSFNDSGL